MNTCCFIPEDVRLKAEEIVKYLNLRILPPIAKFDDEDDCVAQTMVVLGCKNKANWRIVYGNGADPDAYTESCTAHVGEMLTDAPEHRIFPLEGLNTLMP